MNKCDHTIAFKYGEAYGTESGYSIQLSSFLSDINYYEEMMKSDSIYRCDYCPDCGKKLNKIIEDSTLKRKEEIAREKEEKIKKAENDKIIYNEKVVSILSETRLSELNKDLNYYISFNSFEEYEKRDLVILGKPDYIARTLLSCLKGRSLPVNFYFKKIIECPNQNDFYDSFVRHGWTKMARHIQKTDKNKTTKLDYSDEGMVYITYVYNESDLENMYKEYDRTSFPSALNHFQIDMELKEINLK